MTNTTVCAHCHEPLQFHEGEGWTHQDGKLYKTRPMAQLEEEIFERRYGRRPEGTETMVDDHCALPVQEGGK